jgi:hypothetical protein
MCEFCWCTRTGCIQPCTAMILPSHMRLPFEGLHAAPTTFPFLLWLCRGAVSQIAGQPLLVCCMLLPESTRPHILAEVYCHDPVAKLSREFMGIAGRDALQYSCSGLGNDWLSLANDYEIQVRSS